MEQADRERELEGQLRALGELGVLLSAERDASALAGAVLTQARRSFGCAAGQIYLNDGGRLVLLAAQDDSVRMTRAAIARVAPVELDDSAAVPAYVARTGRLVQTDDAYGLTDAPAFDPGLDEALGVRTAGLLAFAVPDPRGEGALGALLLTHHAPIALPAGYEALAGAIAGQACLSLAHARRLDAARDEHLAVVCRLATIAERQDDEVQWHVRRMSGYCVALAQGAGMAPDEVERLRFASTLHDIGKIGIPSEILYKPGKLSEEEFTATKQHTVLGADLLAAPDSPMLTLASEIARSHHERWDGTGYPQGLAGEAIPIAARVAAIADVFDALTTRRIYKPALGIEQSLRIIRQEAGRHFDPVLVQVFQGAFSRILEVKRDFTPEETGS